MKITKKDIVLQGMVAALYFCLTLVTYPISFGYLQFRLSEILLVLCFFNRKYTIGITIGCVLANLTSTIGPIDALIGGAATLLSCLFISFSRCLLLSILFPILINSFAIGAELFYFLKSPFWISVGYVALGETVVLVGAYIIIMFLKKKNRFYQIINANRNIEFKL